MTPDLPTTAASSSAGARSMLTVNLSQQYASRVPLGHGRRTSRERTELLQRAFAAYASSVRGFLLRRGTPDPETLQ